MLHVSTTEIMNGCIPAGALNQCIFKWINFDILYVPHLQYQTPKLPCISYNVCMHKIKRLSCHIKNALSS